MHLLKRSKVSAFEVASLWLLGKDKEFKSFGKKKKKPATKNNLCKYSHCHQGLNF
jgi:hypothetical protein